MPSITARLCILLASMLVLAVIGANILPISCCNRFSYAYRMLFFFQRGKILLCLLSSKLRNQGTKLPHTCTVLVTISKADAEYAMHIHASAIGFNSMLCALCQISAYGIG